MPMLTVQGYYDLHIHSAPAPFQRIGDSVDIARWCAEAGMAGIVIKSHFESTVSKAYHAQREVPNIKVFAGIALNRGVGGVNPGAVELALNLGAKIVWFPTLDAANHAAVYGATGTYGFRAMTLNFKGPSRPRGLFTVLKDGCLSDDAKEVIDLVQAHDAILGTGHLSKEEILAVFEYAMSRKLPKLLITHPEFPVPNLDKETVVQLAQGGAFIEFMATNAFPINGVALARMIELIEAVTPARSVLSTDAGQPFNPRPPETMRVFVQCLYEKGFSEDIIKQMTIHNPAFLLGQ